MADRRMVYPYTLSAKIAQFPLKWHLNNQWVWRYWFISIALCAPVFYSISRLSNSPENKAKWAEIRRKEREPHH
ncbi:hypothetical protein R5R35_013106 [Gryllus longicercus]|uniref:Uncharacterized protein n=1 Tax=Gryllus longicercus TaxID=2509291 RepID=A0AAN9ZIF4_9ORTH